MTGDRQSSRFVGLLLLDNYESKIAVCLQNNVCFDSLILIFIKIKCCLNDKILY